MVSITPAQITALAPHAKPNYKQAFLGADTVLAQYGINNTPLQLAHFMAQVLHESGLLTINEEGMNYTTAKRIHDVWPKRFPKIPDTTQTQVIKGVKVKKIIHPADPYLNSEPYVKNPTALGDKVYNGRMGNDDGTDDGYNYRGRGLLQMTGKADYIYYGNQLKIDLVSHPELAYDALYTLAIAAEEWKRKGCGIPAEADDISTVTRLINGGQIGLAERTALLVLTKAQWPTPPPTAPPAKGK